LFLLGSSAEAPNLSYRLRREVVQRACQVNAGRLPVLVGVTDTSLTEALDLSDYAAEAGAQAIVTATPFYFPVDQPELIRYVEKLVAELPLPLFLYNNPALTRGAFEYDTVRRLAGDERIIGMKDSSGDLAYYQRIAGLRRERPDFSVLIGPEGHLLEGLRLGGCGGINGGANVYPAEVENVLFSHPAVADACVIGVPDEEFGEQVKAVVELRSPATADELIGYCRDGLAHYKCPKSVDFVDAMPRDPNGKIKKRELRDPYWAGHQARI